jgi:phage tail sheath protein FI
MAESLISPGVLARENDQSFIGSRPISFGAAIIGPAVKGPVNLPTAVGSYSQYEAIFGGSVESGSQYYTYLNSIAARNYFAQGGESLLVTRVVTGSFTPASSEIPSQNDDGGKLVTLADALLPSITTNPTNAVDDTYNTVSLSGGSGTGAEATIVVSGNTITSITVTAAGSDYESGDLLDIAAGDLGAGMLASGDLIGQTAAVDMGTVAQTVTIATDTDGAGSGATLSITGDGANALVSVIPVAIGVGYASGDTITITETNLQAAGFTGAVGNLVVTLIAGNITNSSAGVVTLVAGDLQYIPSFTLKTISEGAIMNNYQAVDSANGTLDNGTVDNIRWEVGSVNTASGQFSLFLRRGNDTTTQKAVLETYNNLSLDPTAANYVAKAIGDTYYTIEQDGTDYYVKTNGSYVNRSAYAYISAVNSPTPQYFDNSGAAKAQFTGSLPQVDSGSFAGATGNNLENGDAKFNENITATNIQGINPDDYTSSIKLLSNKDDYQFNVISAPGLIGSLHAQTSQLVSLAQGRTDCISVIDLVPYNSTINTVTTQAAGYDTSYSATYWPWLQTVYAGTGQTVWAPASTYIPAVYAFTDSSSDPWFAPAGLIRGALGSVIRAERKLTSGNRDTLYEANVNPIATFPGSGVVVFGQKTLQKRASALDRVNVRRLLISLKSYITQVSDNLVFEQNTIATRNNFLAQVNPYLESVQQRQGLYAFQVVMDETNNTPDVIDRNELVGQIYLQPTKTAEFVILDFNVLPTGATFPE